MISALVASAVVSLAAKPVKAPFKGELEAADWAGHANGVIATFDDAASKETGKKAVDACLLASSGHANGRAGFVKTQKARLAVVHPNEPATSRAVLALAACLSKQEGVKESRAWFFPRTDSGVEVEAVWLYQKGMRSQRDVYSFHDDPEYTRYVRRQMTRAEWVAHQWKDHPLSNLARTLGLAGRDALEHPNLLMWQTGEFPIDVGEDLAHVTIYLPTGVALQVLQFGERTHISPSSALSLALAATQKANKLGTGDDEATDAKAQQRPMSVWIPRPVLAAAEAVSDARGESLSVLVAKSWRREHAEDGAKPAK